MTQIYAAVRPQRGGLRESMEECRWIEVSQEALDKFFSRGGERDVAPCKVEMYKDYPDERIGWPCTFVVCDRNGHGIGFASYWPLEKA